MTRLREEPQYDQKVMKKRTQSQKKAAESRDGSSIDCNYLKGPINSCSRNMCSSIAQIKFVR